jgi:hypothetical protein
MLLCRPTNMPRSATQKLSHGLLLVFLATTGFAQTAAADQASGSAPVSYSSVTQLNDVLAGLEQAAQTTQVDLAKLRIERWKTDAATKKQTDADVQSIQRNLENALPAVISELRSSPENLTATFKLYRNLDALYDVLTSVVESAGAFGSKDDFQSLQNDLNAIEKSRRALADRMDALSTAKENELGQLRMQLRNMQAAVPVAPPKKVVVDDTEPPKKPSKKKPTKSSKPATTTPPATPPQSPQ